MTGYEILMQKNALERDLMFALETFERKNQIENIRLQLRELQHQCPHKDEQYNFTFMNDKCPYCGKKVVEG